MLHVASSESAYARQSSTFDRQSTEQKVQPETNLKATNAVVMLQLDTQAAKHKPAGGKPVSGKPAVSEPAVSKPAGHKSASRNSAGSIHVALESWISRAMAKAKTKLRS